MITLIIVHSIVNDIIKLNYYYILQHVCVSCSVRYIWNQTITPLPERFLISTAPTSYHNIIAEQYVACCLLITARRRILVCWIGKGTHTSLYVAKLLFTRSNDFLLILSSAVIGTQWLRRRDYCKQTGASDPEKNFIEQGEVRLSGCRTIVCGKPSTYINIILYGVQERYLFQTSKKLSDIVYENILSWVI